MRNETIAIHAGYDPDPATKSVAVPIYQTVAYAFDSADHGAALFNLETEGYRYSRIANPTTAVLEKRVAELEGGVGALAVATGQAALHFALVNLADTGGNIVSVPQLYGTTHTLPAGLPMVSEKTALVFSSISFSIASAWSLSAKRVVMPWRGSTCASRVWVVP